MRTIASALGLRTEQKKVYLPMTVTGCKSIVAHTAQLTSSINAGPVSENFYVSHVCLHAGAGAILSAGLMRLISWDKIDGYFMRGSFASGGEHDQCFKQNPGKILACVSSQLCAFIFLLCGNVYNAIASVNAKQQHNAKDQHTAKHQHSLSHLQLC